MTTLIHMKPIISFVVIQPLKQCSLFFHNAHVIATAKSLQSCPTLFDPIPGILQARTLEWVAISFSGA